MENKSEILKKKLEETNESFKKLEQYFEKSKEKFIQELRLLNKATSKDSQ